MFKDNETFDKKVTAVLSFFNLSGMHRVLTLIFLCSCFSLITMGQTKQGSIKLKSGITLRGEVVDLVYDECVSILLLKDTTFIEWKEIEEIDFQNVRPETVQYIGGRRVKRAPQPYTPEKVYFTLDMANRFGYSPWLVLNPGFSLGVGYNLNENLALGGTAGVDFYWSNFSNIYPLGLEGTYRFQKEGFTPFVKLRSGVALAENRRTWWGDDITVENGLFLSPSVGIANKKREHAGWYLSLSTMIMELSESGTNAVFNGQQWVDVPFERTRNVLRAGFVFGLYIE